METLRAAAVQFESVQADKEANFRTMEGFLARAQAGGVHLVVFPEACITGYWFVRNLTGPELAALAEPIPEGPSTQRLVALARQYQTTVGAGLFETGCDGVYHNSYVVVSPEGTVHRHRKLHAFEHALVASGSEYTVFDTGYGWRMAVLICYDCNLVENVGMVALQGADLLIAPHQTGGCRTRNPHLMGLVDRRLWDKRACDPQTIEAEFHGEKGRGWLLRWLPSRAHDNGMFLVFANGVGVDDDEVRTGNAMVLDPYGRILVETGRAADDMVVADLDPALLARATGREWMQARRPALYGPLTVPTGRERDAHQLKFEE